MLYEWNRRLLVKRDTQIYCLVATTVLTPDYAWALSWPTRKMQFLLWFVLRIKSFLVDFIANLAFLESLTHWSRLTFTSWTTQLKSMQQEKTGIICRTNTCFSKAALNVMWFSACSRITGRRRLLTQLLTCSSVERLGGWQALMDWVSLASTALDSSIRQSSDGCYCVEDTRRARTRARRCCNIMGNKFTSHITSQMRMWCMKHIRSRC